MKKLIALLLALVLSVSFMACAAKEEPKPEVEEEPTVETPEVEEPVVDEPVEEEPVEDEPAELPEEEVLPEEDVVVEPEIEFMPEEKYMEMSGLMDQLVANMQFIYDEYDEQYGCGELVDQLCAVGRG